MFIFLFFIFFFLSPAIKAESYFSKNKKVFLEESSLNTSQQNLKNNSLRGLHLKPFPVIYNPEVKRWIKYFSQTPSTYMALWLKRSYRYFPLMEKILQSRGLPKELVSITLIESNLSPRAVSSAQAVGYWQFIEPTGFRFGLRINHWIDERRDFRKSTQAAARYLYQLYEEFEDWLLSMAAYNMGEVRLRGLIKKYKENNFWVLYKKSDFPRETALYVPKVLAAAHIIKNPELYGLSEFPILTPYNYDIFFTPGGTNLEKMSVETEISLSQLKILNPDLKTNRIPNSISSHPIRIPEGSGLLISKWLDKQKKSN